MDCLKKGVAIHLFKKINVFYERFHNDTFHKLRDKARDFVINNFIHLFILYCPQSY